MSLAARRTAVLKEKLVMRLGCVLVSVAVLASLVLQPPKAKAFAVTSSAVSALAGGFLSACGLTPVVSGTYDAQGVAESMDRMIREYLDTMGSPTPEEWLGQELALTVTGGKIFLPKPIAGKLGQFAVWVAAKYAMNADGTVKPGVNQVYSTDGLYAFHLDGSYVFSGGSDPLRMEYSLDHPGSVTSSLNKSVLFGFGSSFSVSLTLGPGIYEFRRFLPRLIDGSFDHSFESLNSWVISGWSNFDGSYSFVDEDANTGTLTFEVHDSLQVLLSFFLCAPKVKRLNFAFPLDITRSWIKRVDQAESSFGLDVSDTMQEVLERLTALEEGQSIALDVGATQSMELQEILQGILDAILAGDLAASAEVVDTAEVPIDPEEPDPPIVIPSGLEELGAALTSRFPFSIPWDVYKGVTLLAAPPKAPYFEVDFFEPIGHLVGGWKGSTKIVLDMSEYEIVGQVCRWTSTIGFCLMLASGTKRLIWTA